MLYEVGEPGARARMSLSSAAKDLGGVRAPSCLARGARVLVTQRANSPLKSSPLTDWRGVFVSRAGWRANRPAAGACRSTVPAVEAGSRRAANGSLNRFGISPGLSLTSDWRGAILCPWRVGATFSKERRKGLRRIFAPNLDGKARGRHSRRLKGSALGVCAIFGGDQGQRRRGTGWDVCLPPGILRVPSSHPLASASVPAIARMARSENLAWASATEREAVAVPPCRRCPSRLGIAPGRCMGRR